MDVEKRDAKIVDARVRFSDPEAPDLVTAVNENVLCDLHVLQRKFSAERM